MGVPLSLSRSYEGDRTNFMTYISTFSSSFDAILANRTLSGAGFDAQLMPVPRAVSSSCGACVRFHAESVPPVLDRVSASGLYHEEQGGWKKIK